MVCKQGKKNPTRMKRMSAVDYRCRFRFCLPSPTSHNKHTHIPGLVSDTERFPSCCQLLLTLWDQPCQTQVLLVLCQMTDEDCGLREGLIHFLTGGVSGLTGIGLSLNIPRRQENNKFWKLVLISVWMITLQVIFISSDTSDIQLTGKHSPAGVLRLFHPLMFSDLTNLTSTHVPILRLALCFGELFCCYCFSGTKVVKREKSKHTHTRTHTQENI